MYVLRGTMIGRHVILAGLLLAPLITSAQHGIRAIFWDYEPIYGDGFSQATMVGLGYDHDLNERISNAVQFRLSTGGDTWVANYRSAYHFADTDGASFYTGPVVGLRSIKGSTESSMLVPLGFRMGVRGGLEGFFADLHAGFVYNVGGTGRLLMERSGAPVDILPFTFNVGLHMGLGWDRR